MDTKSNKDRSFDTDELSPSQSFRKLLCQIRNGSEEAIWQLVEDFSPHVFRVVRRRMNSSLTRRIGVSDVVQATWASFLIRERDLSRFETKEEMRAYIVGIAMNKLRMFARTHIHAEARDLRREIPLDANTEGPPVATEPSPSELIGFRESWKLFMEQQPKHYQQIVELRIQGHTLADIAQRLRINERTVRRVLKQLANTLPIQSNG